MGAHREFDPRVWGYVNGTPVYSRDEFIFKCRGFGQIETDEELITFAEKASHNWYNAGHHDIFRTYYLSDYALSEPYKSLTITEFNRLKELQKMERAEYEKAEEEREWKKIDTVYWADNSIDEIWQDKYGNKKSVMVTGPHGD